MELTLKGTTVARFLRTLQKAVKKNTIAVSSLHFLYRFSLFFLVVFIIASPAYGQGGPPMITDDPFTPENGHWENNFAIQFTGTSLSKEIDIPQADINYGYGDHIQLKIQMPVMEYFHNGSGSLIGTGDVMIGMKARFLDEEQSGIAVSTYPQFEFNNSSITGGGESPQFFLPLEAAKTFGRFHYDAEVGYSFFASGPDGLAFGIVTGFDQSEQCQFLAELHGDNQFHVGLNDIILNLGLTYEISTALSFLGSAGTSIYSLEPGRTYIAYLGIRWML